jgi:succinyl-CoA synthetase beta subunit
MKLFEYQAKEVFIKMGIKVPEGIVAKDYSEVVDAADKIGYPCVLKSQVLRGGRGKAGLIRFVTTGREAEENARELFKSCFNVKKILIEKAVNIKSEVYISVTVDALEGKATIMACSEGGIDIETLALESPEKIFKEWVDMNSGLSGFQVRDLAYRMGFDGDLVKKVSNIIVKMYDIFRKYDAELVEINPLLISQENDVVAGDGKLVIDDNSMFRQPGYELSREYFDSDVEYEAAIEGIPYLQFDGSISLMCAGAGLTTTVYDLINYAGGSVANFLEFGGPNYKKAEKAMELCLKNCPKVILIVTFGTIARADVMAQGIVDAMEKLKPKIPIVTCIRGTNEEQATDILNEAGLECIFDTEEAVKRAVDIASARRS